MPAKMVARMTEMNVKIAEPNASLESPEKVRGREIGRASCRERVF